MPGSSHSLHRCQVAASLVSSCAAVRRSKYALLTMPCRPGPTPVSADVWLTSVTLGNSAIAPPRNAHPVVSNRATLGNSPDAAIAYNEFELQPSHNSPTT